MIRNLLSSCLLSKSVKIKIITFPVVFYGCKTWSAKLMEEHRLRKLNGPNREEDTRDCRRQRNEGLRELCCAAE